MKVTTAVIPEAADKYGFIKGEELNSKIWKVNGIVKNLESQRDHRI